MKSVKDILILASWSSNDKSASTYLIYLLNRGLNNFKINTKLMLIGDYIFKKPRLIQPLNIPFIIKELKKHNIVLGWGLESSYILTFAKPFIKGKIIYRIVGLPYEEAYLKRKIQTKSQIKNSLILYETAIIHNIGISKYDYYIACSDKLKKYYIDKGVDKNYIVTIRNSVDTNLFRPRKYPVSKTDNKDFTVLYAGGFQEYQGINNLIDAASLLDQYNIKFKIIGFKNNELTYKKYIKSRLKSKAVLLDRLSRYELVNQINNSDVCIIPRERNVVTEVAFPTKFAEYIATGKPVITTNVGEIPKFVKRYNCGFICEPNSESIAKSILEAKETKKDSLLLKGLNGRKLALNEFDNLVITKKFLNYLSHIA